MLQSEMPLPVTEFVNLREFCEQLSDCLPALVRWLRTIAQTPGNRLAAYFPLSTPGYGEGESRGHVIRPDIVITAAGPKVCEFDFVPSGRGRLSAWLPGPAERAAYLEVFRRWYERMDARRYYYGTGSITTCWEQTIYVCDELRAMDVDIVPGNLDRDPVGGRAIDRLYYRAELAREHPGGLEVFTREPYLDSKALFAALHSEDASLSIFTARQLSFLRTVCPYSFPLQTVNARMRNELVESKDRYVLKNTDVETHYNWGSRGALPGRVATHAQFEEALDGKMPELGSFPIVQEFHESLDFSELWDEAARTRPQELFGDQMSPVVSRPATEAVYGRASVYFLLDNPTGRCEHTPWGYLILRQHPLVHWTNDSQAHTFPVG